MVPFVVLGVLSSPACRRPPVPEGVVVVTKNGHTLAEVLPILEPFGGKLDPGVESKAREGVFRFPRGADFERILHALRESPAIEAAAPYHPFHPFHAFRPSSWAGRLAGGWRRGRRKASPRWWSGSTPRAAASSPSTGSPSLRSSRSRKRSGSPWATSPGCPTTAWW